MGRHKEWRAIAKRMRRKRIRQKLAQERDKRIMREQEEREKSPRYQAWLREQNILEEFRQEEEARLQLERQQQWEHNEKLAQQQWIEHQAKMLKAREEKVKQEMRIREEWEFEQKKIQETEEEKKRKEAEKIKKLEELMRQIDDFIKHGGEIPESVNISTETNPDKPLCPFFAKTGACRFSDRCSRNHPRPGISHVLLIPNFYTHFGLQHSMLDEYDTDLMLEYEDSETYQHFKEFYEDVVPEFESFGRVVQFKVCCNYEPHLRGNVYVEYSSTRDAVAAFQKLQGRYYGGRQLNVEFTSITSWKSALCGLFFKKRCPKGRSCNFLHVFRNPKNAFSNADHHTRKYLHASSLHSQSRSTSRSPSRRKSQRNKEDREHWRWSESPEPVIHQLNGDSKHKEHGSSPRRQRDKIKEKSRANRRSESRSGSSSRNRRRSRSRSRSWSRDRNTSSRRSTSHRKERKRKKSHSKSGLED